VTTPSSPGAAAETMPAALDRIYRSLTRGSAEPGAPQDLPGSPARADQAWHALDRLCTLFGLSTFERDLIVLCAGHGLQSRFVTACAAAAGDPRAAWPTFALAMTVLDNPHWSAVSPARPLRHWQLLETDRGSVLHGPLRLDERILHFLIGVPAIDERLQALARPLMAPAAPAGAGERRQPLAVRAGIRHWERPGFPGYPLLLIGTQRSACEAVFADMCQCTGLQPYTLHAGDIPAAASERDQLARLWAREAALTGAALYLRTKDGDDVANVSAWLEQTDALVAVEVQSGTPAEQLTGARLPIAAPSTQERKETWIADLGPLALQMNGYLDRVAEYFHFDEPAIHLSAAAVREQAEASERADVGEVCWHVCREHARRSLETLARRVETRAGWDDLVLPGPQVETLRQIAIHMRQRDVVNERWGFAAKHPRGLGLTALFAGSSGTGKTMAAEILGAELDLDLYKIDLASVVSKYIGETEKNLRAIFAAAEQSGAILLFDEADALFGKRSEVRDSHDRYANLEISYLLQQMESYRGVAILTTNMQNALDPAFLRRIRFIVQFPFPDEAARARIWRRIFPAITPLANLDFDRLAQLNVAGGAIRNIAMHAAFLAADDSMLVESSHILAAARTEYAKMGKLLTTAETRDLT
jgi:ATPase family associated with various cellular activities (AAA)